MKKFRMTDLDSGTICRNSSVHVNQYSLVPNRQGTYENRLIRFSRHRRVISFSSYSKQLM